MLLPISSFKHNQIEIVIKDIQMLNIEMGVDNIKKNKPEQRE